MTDLQDALESQDERWFMTDDTPSIEERLILEAARLVANPNIEAAMGRFYELWNGDNELTLEEIWSEAVAAALTPGDTK